jgi:SAM-dependent methyltransferase
MIRTRMRGEDWNEKWRGRLTESRHAETSGEANRFLVAVAAGLPPGHALDLACGAGRNAVWLAANGWDVVGVDFSEVGLAAARRLAEERGVEVELHEADLLGYEPAESAYDLVAILYLQVPKDERRIVLRRAAVALGAGGRLLVVGHDSANLTEGYGGPKDPRVLYTADDVAGDLQDLGIERAERVERPVMTPEGERVALDALVVARRADA